MTPNDYQSKCFGYALDRAKSLSYLITGLCAEAGEVAGKYAKWERDGDEDCFRAIPKEVGDVLWFCAMLCTKFGLSLEDVMRQNIEKLESRKQRGKIGGSGDDR